MGNTNHYHEMKQKYGEIFVQTDKPFYQSGENIFGNIYINLHTPFNA